MAIKKRKLDIGIDVDAPSGSCTSVKCPWHGHLKVRGRIFTGIVTSNKVPGTVTVKWNYYQYIPKYERYERRKTSLAAHNPNCIGAREGDTVKIGECRPISKTKSFVVIEKIAGMKK